MVSPAIGSMEYRVLVCAPRGRDAHLIAQILEKTGIECEAIERVSDLSSEIARGVGTIILAEESLSGSVDSLIQGMSGQPSWSDLPLIILTTGDDVGADRTWALIQRLDPIGNVSLLERPLRTITLISAVQVALRSRARQYDLRGNQQELEQRVQDRTAELQRLNEEAEGFSYTIAHDLRSPLRAIISTSRILLEDFGPQLPSEAADELERQSNAASRLAKLIDDLLKLSKLSRAEMQPTEFDMTALARDVAEELAKDEFVGECSIEIQPGMIAFGDPLLIRFALYNLIQNACKFSPDGGIVEIGKDGKDFFVKDSGIGFEPEYAEKIFQPFERLVDMRSFPGTGIGLANVKRIIERHGGKVRAESEPNRGSNFSFSLG